VERLGSLPYSELLVARVPQALPADRADAVLPPDGQEEQLRPPSHNSSTQSAIMDDFRRQTIGAMRQATSSLRLAVARSQAAIGSTRAALLRLNELARTIDHELAARRVIAAIPQQSPHEHGLDR
jgi:hypothetical protein